MKHRVKSLKLSRSPGAKEALLRNLAHSLIDQGKIKTTLAKAKAVQPLVDRLISIAKKDSLSRRRLIESRLGGRKIVKKLFQEVLPRFDGRESGFTRIIHVGMRRGDGAKMALLEFSALPPPPKEKDKKGTKEAKVTKEVKERKAKEVKKPKKAKEQLPEGGKDGTKKKKSRK